MCIRDRPGNDDEAGGSGRSMNGLKTDTIINRDALYALRELPEESVHLSLIHISGLNMERPDLQRMLRAIERRQINLVITKDLSRLGRNYLQTGHLICLLYTSRCV